MGENYITTTKGVMGDMLRSEGWLWQPVHEGVNLRASA